MSKNNKNCFFAQKHEPQKKISLLHGQKWRKTDHFEKSRKVQKKMVKKWGILCKLFFGLPMFTFLGARNNENRSIIIAKDLKMALAKFY